ncbi:TetR/AcrR family transcriptional regulator [Streptomyces profundus]|nr:TetR/AcrR family transcriptional regulator [Streptomyces sp. MA3_2.13]
MPEHQPKARPLRRDAEQSRRGVVQAGREVCADRGVSATLNDVPHHAGLGVGTVYRRFPDKASLAEAVFADELADIQAMAGEALTDDGACSRRSLPSWTRAGTACQQPWPPRCHAPGRLRTGPTGVSAGRVDVGLWLPDRPRPRRREPPGGCDDGGPPRHRGNGRRHHPRHGPERLAPLPHHPPDLPPHPATP